MAELGSLSRPAETLGLSNAAASRHLAALEERLAARLVHRNTRRLFLTDVGEAYYRRCKPLQGELKDAESAINEAVLKPTGVLRVTASLTFAMNHIAPLLQRAGTPQTPDELLQHRLLIYNLANHPEQLRFTRDGVERVIALQGLLEANDSQVLRAAALKHLGILVQPLHIVYDDVVAGRPCSQTGNCRG